MCRIDNGFLVFRNDCASISFENDVHKDPDYPIETYAS